MGYENINTNIYETGIVATLEGNKEGPCLLFRSEMDAVVMDETGRVKHTCGHDAHMASLLALAEILIKNKDRIKGKVKLVFEPDEEGNGGAKAMIENGILENPRVDKAFAIHVWSELKEDTIGVKEGAVMASTDPFEITVFGKGGHAAIPEKCVDTLYIASNIAKNVKEMSKLEKEKDNRIVLGITAIIGGKNNNVIPDKVYLKGICRTFNNQIREKVKEDLKQNVEKIAEQFGGKAELKFIGNYPATINDVEETKKIYGLSTKIAQNVETNYKTMCSEDFSYFLEKVPGTLILVGCQKDEYYPQHSENFSVGENTMLLCTQMLYEIVKKYLF